jgi:hypothetical protein
MQLTYEKKLPRKTLEKLLADAYAEQVAQQQAALLRHQQQNGEISE